MGVNNVVGGPIAQIGIAFYGGDGTRGAEVLRRLYSEAGHAITLTMLRY